MRADFNGYRAGGYAIGRYNETGDFFYQHATVTSKSS